MSRWHWIFDNPWGGWIQDADGQLHKVGQPCHRWQHFSFVFSPTGRQFEVITAQKADVNKLDTVSTNILFPSPLLSSKLNFGPFQNNLMKAFNLVQRLKLNQYMPGGTPIFKGTLCKALKTPPFSAHSSPKDSIMLCHPKTIPPYFLSFWSKKTKQNKTKKQKQMCHSKTL